VLSYEFDASVYVLYYILLLLWLNIKMYRMTQSNNATTCPSIQRLDIPWNELVTRHKSTLLRRSPPEQSTGRHPIRTIGALLAYIFAATCVRHTNPISPTVRIDLARTSSATLKCHTFVQTGGRAQAVAAGATGDGVAARRSGGATAHGWWGCASAGLAGRAWRALRWVSIWMVRT
jgi:hypothetical protein